MLYAVWYNAVGCLPDSDEPEFVGTLDACESYIDRQIADGVPSVGEASDRPGNLYSFGIDEWAEEEDEQDYPEPECDYCGRIGHTFRSCPKRDDN
jgi:hypothetical protein